MTYPHCDALVLHAPGECDYCDDHGEWQQLRVMWKINFTGKREDGFTICPSEARRDLATINEWAGNRPASSTKKRL